MRRLEPAGVSERPAWVAPASREPGECQGVFRRFLPRVGAAIILYAVAPTAVGVELSPCTLTASEGRQEVRAQCTTLAVPLNPDDSAAGTLELFVAVVPALTESAAPDPLTVIAGGPGDSATRFFAQAEQAFALIRRTRDIVLVDQRGSGGSAPLHCEKFRELGPLADVATDVDTIVEMTLDCLDELEHDPRFFTTSPRRGRSRAGTGGVGIRTVQPLRHLLRDAGRPALPATLPRAHAQRHPGRRRAARPGPRSGHRAREPGGPRRAVRPMPRRRRLPGRVSRTPCAFPGATRTRRGDAGARRLRTSPQRRPGGHRRGPPRHGRRGAAPAVLSGDDQPDARTDRRGVRRRLQATRHPGVPRRHRGRGPRRRIELRHRLHGGRAVLR